MENVVLAQLNSLPGVLWSQKYEELIMTFKLYEDDNGQFDVNTFTDLLKTVVPQFNEDDAEKLFYQIDCYSRGLITYNDFFNHLEYLGENYVINKPRFVKFPNVHSCLSHRDLVRNLYFYPELPEVEDVAAGHYLALSKNGLLVYLNGDMEITFQHSVKTAQDPEGLLNWVTALACFPKEKILAVSTTACDIRFFRSNPHNFELLFSIVSFPYCIMTLNNSIPSCDSKTFFLVCGDISGKVALLKIKSRFLRKMWMRAPKYQNLEKIKFDCIDKEVVPGLEAYMMWKEHVDQVLKAQYIPSIDAIVSCTACTTKALLVHFLEENRSLETDCNEGILCFSYSKKLHCILTGGMDFTVKLWNPLTINTSRDTMTGHRSPICEIFVDDKRQIVITADYNKNVRVWDLLRRFCREHFSCYDAALGSLYISSALYNYQNGELLLATFKIAVFKPSRPELRETHAPNKTMAMVTYDKLFNCVITVGEESTICLWDIKNGKLINEFQDTHQAVKNEFEMKTLKVTAARLHPNERRLVTAAEDGKVKVWNFHIGRCLREFQTAESLPLLSVCFIGFHIYVAGWNRRVTVFYDNGKDNFDDRFWDVKHEDTVVSIDAFQNRYLASVSFDGEIIIWGRKTGFAETKIKDIQEMNSGESEDTIWKLISRYQDCSINRIMFLYNRKAHSSIGNLITCGKDGYIRLWNSLRPCELLAKFRGTQKPHAVASMTSDERNKYLITGDSVGYIRVYELESYFNDEMAFLTIPHLNPEHFRRYPFLRFQRIVNKTYPKYSKFPSETQGDIPLLLNCFRGHLQSIERIAFVDGKDLILSGGYEGSVRLWTLAGTYIGRFGPKSYWNLDELRYDTFGVPSYMPLDVKRVASPTTLKVLNNGKSPLWYRSLQLLKYYRSGDDNFTTGSGRAKDFLFQQSLEQSSSDHSCKKILSDPKGSKFVLTDELAGSFRRRGFVQQIKKENDGIIKPVTNVLSSRH